LALTALRASIFSFRKAVFSAKSRWVAYSFSLSGRVSLYTLLKSYMAFTHRYRNWMAYEPVLARSSVNYGSTIIFSCSFLISAGLIFSFLYSVRSFMRTVASLSRYFLAVSK
jgi:glucose-6-phosphate-specific signal transduction histidine kinase